MHRRKTRRKYEAIRGHRLTSVGHSLSTFDPSEFFIHFMFTEGNILILFLNYSFEKNEDSWSSFGKTNLN